MVKNPAAASEKKRETELFISESNCWSIITDSNGIANLKKIPPADFTSDELEALFNTLEKLQCKKYQIESRNAQETETLLCTTGIVKGKSYEDAALKELDAIMEKQWNS